MDTTTLAATLLRCGTLDTNYLLDLAERHELSVPELVDEASCRTANNLIEAALRHIAKQFIDSLPSRVRLHASTLDYEVYTNNLDSTLQFDDEHIDAHFQEWLRREP
jgi:hypothetical protein